MQRVGLAVLLLSGCSSVDWVRSAEPELSNFTRLDLVLVAEDGGPLAGVRVTADGGYRDAEFVGVSDSEGRLGWPLVPTYQEGGIRDFMSNFPSEPGGLEYDFLSDHSTDAGTVLGRLDQRLAAGDRDIECSTEGGAWCVLTLDESVDRVPEG